MTLKRKSKELDSNEGKRLASLLRAISDLVERSSPEQIDALIDGRSVLGIQRSGSKPVRSTSCRSRHVVNESTRDIATRLSTYNSRSEGREFLKMSFSQKADIEDFARHLDVPVRNSDSVDRLFDKIVESVIGARLRSEAVQGKKLKSAADVRTSRAGPVKVAMSGTHRK